MAHGSGGASSGRATSSLGPPCSRVERPLVAFRSQELPDDCPEGSEDRPEPSVRLL
jgi:hypothetical protein